MSSVWPTQVDDMLRLPFRVDDMLCFGAVFAICPSKVDAMLQLEYPGMMIPFTSSVAFGLAFLR